MNLCLALVLGLGLALGCDGDSDRPPNRPGGAGTGGAMPGPDGSVGIDSGFANVITGLVCPVLDLRFPTSCDPLQDPAGIDVLDLSSQAVGLADSSGAFSVSSNDPANATLVVAGEDATRRPSVLSTALFGGSATVVAPVMLLDDHDQLTASLGVIEPNDTASIALYAQENGVPVPGVNVVAPAGSINTFYDADDPTVWDPIGPTQTRGAVLMFGVPLESGLTDFTVIRPDQTVLNVQDVPVQSESTTVVRVEI